MRWHYADYDTIYARRGAELLASSDGAIHADKIAYIRDYAAYVVFVCAMPR